MKQLLIAGLALLSAQTFAQSYVILNNGVTLTIDKAGYIYDFTQFTLPYKVNVAGGQFFVADGELETVDEKGFLYQKDYKVKKVVGKGLNYFVNDDSKLVTIDANGFYYEYKEGAVKKIRVYGGNYFTSVKDEKKNIVELYTVNTKGNYYKMSVPGLDAANIMGSGNYFLAGNVLYTVSKDGIVFAKTDKTISGFRRMGGNYFVDSGNFLYTVSEEGFVFIPILPPKMLMSDIVKFGSNYMIDKNGRIFVVDKAGTISERTVKGHDLSDAKILSI